jgi:hypothetical protein
MNSEERGELFSSLTLALMCPDVSKAINLQDDANVRLQLTRLAAGLAAYRAKNRVYPATLEALMPGVLENLPIDLYSSTPFIYKPQGDGFLLYSVGANGRDDGGSGADDISVVIPPPAFAAPTPTK